MKTNKNNKIRFTLIGLGTQTLNDHIPSLLRSSDAEIVSVCDPYKKSHQNFSEKYPELSKKVKHYYDYERINYKDVDCAIVAVPHNEYFGIVSKLCKNKIYFMKEKPLARDLKETNKLLRMKCFKKYGFVCTQRRYNPLYKIAYTAIPSLGKLYRFNAIYSLNIEKPEEGWRGDVQKAGGGCVLDMGYHIVDQLIWWLGQPDELNCFSSSEATEGVSDYAEDSATISFRYKNGLHGLISLTRSGGAKEERYQINGSRGHIEGNKKVLVIRNKKGEIVGEHKLESDDEMIDNQLQTFMEVVKRKGSFGKIVERNSENMIFMDKCYKKQVKTKDEPGVVGIKAGKPGYSHQLSHL